MPMQKENDKSKGTRFLVILAVFVIAIAGMREAASLLVPFLLSIFIAVISASPMFWLTRKGIPTVLAILIVATGVFVIGLVIVALIGTSLNDFSQALPAYQERFQEKTQILLALLERMGLDLSDQGLLEVFDPGAAMGLVVGILNGLKGVLTNGFLIMLTAIFILLEASSFPIKLRAILTDPKRSLSYFEKFIYTVQRYIAIKTLISLGTGIAIAIWLLILGVDYPLLLGLLAFLLNYVPTIGSILAAVPAVLLTLLQLGMGKVLLVVMGYLVVNIVVGNVIEPRIMGRGLGLSTLVVFLSVVFWGWVFGPVGMLLSVPLTMTVKIALDSNEDTRWIAILLGSEASVEDVRMNSSKEVNNE
jgi:predicted PurR-regulated permease PerM